MGTSSSHRSPSTPEWERVKQLYRQPNADPGHIASQIVSALDMETRREMSGLGVACCLTNLLQSGHEVASNGLDSILSVAQAPVLINLSQTIRERAEREIALAGLASRFTDIALNAVGTAAFEIGSGGSAEIFSIPAATIESNLRHLLTSEGVHGLARCFLAHDFDHLFRYFVTRDTADFVGGEGLPTVAHASQLRDAVARYCRDSITRIEMVGCEQSLLRALAQPGPEGLSQTQGILTDLTELGLQQLAAGG